MRIFEPTGACMNKIAPFREAENSFPLSVRQFHSCGFKNLQVWVKDKIAIFMKLLYSLVAPWPLSSQKCAAAFCWFPRIPRITFPMRSIRNSANSLRRSMDSRIYLLWFDFLLYFSRRFGVSGNRLLWKWVRSDHSWTRSVAWIEWYVLVIYKGALIFHTSAWAWNMHAH